MGDRLNTGIVVQSFEQAIYHRQPKEELMHHSDKGCQYTSQEFRELAKEKNIKLSMSGLAMRVSEKFLLVYLVGSMIISSSAPFYRYLVASDVALV
jgi:hypothetical protein